MRLRLTSSTEVADGVSTPEDADRLAERFSSMDDPYADVKTHFETVDAVTVNSGRGAQGLKLGKKMFVMFHKGDLLVQLPPARVDELVASGEGLAFDPGTGKTMANRVLIPVANNRSWIALCEESQRYVESG